MTAPNRIAFGSCNDQERINNLWRIVERRKPSAFIWGGDAIYADYSISPDWSQFPSVSFIQGADPTRLRKLYNKQKQVPGYRELLKTNITVFGTFDDHDFGIDNGDRTYEFRHESAIEYVNFLGLPISSPMRRRAHAGLGVYGVKLFDFDRPVGQYEVPDEEANIDPDLFPDQTQDEVFSPVQENYSNKSVAVFVLDIRSNKTPWKRGIEAFRPDLEGDFLGEHQWNWLETAIRRSKAAVNVVVSGVQVHPSIVSNGNVCEAWSHYPKAQQRLFDTLLSEGVQAPVIVSGDVHMSQMLQKDCLKTDGSGMRRPLFEMTTSGMTHSWGSLSSPPLSNPNQKSTFLEKYLNFLASSTMHVLQTFSPWTDLMISDSSPDSRSLDNRHVTSGLQYSLEQNFGELEFDWKNRVLIARTIGHGPDEGEILLSAKWNMDELSGTMEASEKYLTQNDFVVTETKEHATTEDGWVCINHRGQPGLARQLVGHTMTIASFAVLFPVPLFLPCALAFVLCRRNRRRASSAWKSKSAWFV